MDKIEVAEYIRTIQGYISKVKSIDKDYIHCDSVILEYYDEYTTLPLSKLHEYDMTAEDYITKHSFNIIDLIEEGDFVNDKKVKINYKDAILFEDGEDIVEQQIKSIVTKEMFQNVEYRVESN